MEQAKKRLSKGRVCGIFLGSVIFLLFTTLVSFVLNSGSVFGMAVGISIVLCAVFSPKIKGSLQSCRNAARGKALLTVGAVLLTVFCLWAITVTVLVVRGFAAASAEIPENSPAVVLGCGVNGEKPSAMLNKRIDAAYDYLTENPQAVCILSGGKGDGENLSEARCMYNALTEKGIAPERLYLEENSTSTAENMQYSKQILTEKGLGDTVVLITTDFHQFRAGLLAEKQGLQTYKVSARSGVFALPTFIVREWFTCIGYFFA